MYVRLEAEIQTPIGGFGVCAFDVVWCCWHLILLEVINVEPHKGVHYKAGSQEPISSSTSFVWGV